MESLNTNPFILVKYKYGGVLSLKNYLPMLKDSRNENSTPC